MNIISLPWRGVEQDLPRLGAARDHAALRVEANGAHRRAMALQQRNPLPLLRAEDVEALVRASSDKMLRVVREMQIRKRKITAVRRVRVRERRKKIGGRMVI